MTIKPGAALLFDIDGTLVHSDPLHLIAFNRALEPHGETFDHARFAAELQGFANVAIGAKFLPKLSIPEREAVLNLKEQAFRDLAAPASIRCRVSWTCCPGPMKPACRSSPLPMPRAPMRNCCSAASA